MPAQPSNSWSLQVLNAQGGAAAGAQTLASLGIESATYDLNNLAADMLTFTVGGKAIDAATIWPYGTLIALLNPNGARAFVGRVEPWSREGTPDKQNHIGRLANPWWYLEHLIYQQRYTTAVWGPDDALRVKPPVGLVVSSTSRVVLNVLANGVGGAFQVVNTGAQITDALAWAILKGAPIALGEMDPSTQPFSKFEKGIMCSQVIIRMHQHEPDFVMDWDYTTLPFPTVHFRKAVSLKPLVIDLTQPGVREQVTIKERPDWQRSYVSIFYDQTIGTANGQFLNIYQDLYPNPAPQDTESNFTGVDLYADLGGTNVNGAVTQAAVFASVPFDITSIATWLAWKPDLGDKTNANVVIENGGGKYAAPVIAPLNELDGNGNQVALNPACIYEVVEGTWCDWIPNIAAQKVRVTAYITITGTDGSVTHQPHSHDMTVISVNTAGIVQTVTANSASPSNIAEPIPVGLAQAMWTSWQAIAIEGGFTNCEAVIGSTQPITRSNCLNFNTPNQPAWANLNTPIQQITGDIMKGTTKVKFGAPLKITGNELIDAMRSTRWRITTIDLGYLFGGALGGGAGGTVRLSRKTHARSSQHGRGQTMIAVHSSSTAPVPGTDPVITHNGTNGVTTWSPPNQPVTTPPAQVGTQVTIDPSQTFGADKNYHPVSIQPVKCCVNIAGTLKQRTVMALVSAPFQAPDDPA